MKLKKAAIVGNSHTVDSCLLAYNCIENFERYNRVIINYEKLKL